MYIYAQLNAEDIVVGISQLSGELLADDMILINNMDIDSGYLYDRVSGTFTEPVDSEPDLPVETMEEKIARLESTTELNSLITIDAVLGVYEEVLALREEVAELKANNEASSV